MQIVLINSGHNESANLNCARLNVSFTCVEPENFNFALCVCYLKEQITSWGTKVSFTLSLSLSTLKCLNYRSRRGSGEKTFHIPVMAARGICIWLYYRARRAYLTGIQRVFSLWWSRTTSLHSFCRRQWRARSNWPKTLQISARYSLALS